MARLDKEWSELQQALREVDQSHFAITSLEPRNMPKNRYSDILPCTLIISSLKPELNQRGAAR